MAESVELARLAVADGTSLVTVTPHVRDLLRARHPRRAARARGRGAGGAARAPACRWRYAPAPSWPTTTSRCSATRELDAIAQGPAGARWVLIEAPLFGGDLDGFLAATAEVRARGFGTLIGHPERCAPLMEAPARSPPSAAPARGCRSTARRSPAATATQARAWGSSCCAPARPT